VELSRAGDEDGLVHPRRAGDCSQIAVVCGVWTGVVMIGTQGAAKNSVERLGALGVRSLTGNFTSSVALAEVREGVSGLLYVHSAVGWAVPSARAATRRHGPPLPVLPGC
jgi:hypothetical protein